REMSNLPLIIKDVSNNQLKLQPTSITRLKIRLLYGQDHPIIDYTIIFLISPIIGLDQNLSFLQLSKVASCLLHPYKNSGPPAHTERETGYLWPFWRSLY